MILLALLLSATTAPATLPATYIEERVEMGSAVQIYDANNGFFLAIDERSKTWYQVPAEALRRSDMVAPASSLGIGVDEDGSPRVPEMAFRKSARAESIGTWKKAEVWEAVEPDVRGAKATLWCARDFPLRWSSLQDVVRQVFGGTESPHDGWFDQAARLPGWPVRVEQTSPGRRMRVEVTRVEPATVAPALFQPPGDGYQHVSDPSGFTTAAKPPVKAPVSR